jgi:hypothetical protein
MIYRAVFLLLSVIFVNADEILIQMHAGIQVIYVSRWHGNNPGFLKEVDGCTDLDRGGGFFFSILIGIYRVILYFRHLLCPFTQNPPLKVPIAC